MSIHFKFKSAKEYDTVSFPGNVIRVIDLKKAIVEKKKLARGLDFELVLQNAQSGEVYEDDSQQLNKNTSVTVKRIPAKGPAGLLARLKAEEAKMAASNIAPVVTTTMPNTASAVTSSTADTTTTAAPQTMEDEMAALQNIHKQAEDLRGPRVGNRTWTATGGSSGGGGASANYAARAAPTASTNTSKPSGGHYGPSSNSAMDLQPPPNYVCYRCGTAGHYIQHCPTNGNPDFDGPRIKKKTGIPKTFMKTIEDPNEVAGDSGLTVVNAPWGGFAVIQPQNKDFSKLVEQSGGSKTLEDIRNTPPSHLACPICSKLMHDAVLIPCCTESACDECIRNALIHANMTCPLCKAPNMSPEGLLSNKVLRKSVDEFLRDARTKQQDQDKLVKETEAALLAKQRAEANAISEAAAIAAAESADAILNIKKSKFDEGDDEFGGDIFDVSSKKPEQPVKPLVIASKAVPTVKKTPESSPKSAVSITTSPVPASTSSQAQQQQQPTIPKTAAAAAGYPIHPTPPTQRSWPPQQYGQKPSTGGGAYYQQQQQNAGRPPPVPSHYGRDGKKDRDDTYHRKDRSRSRSGGHRREGDNRSSTRNHSRDDDTRRRNHRHRSTSQTRRHRTSRDEDDDDVRSPKESRSSRRRTSREDERRRRGSSRRSPSYESSHKDRSSRRKDDDDDDRLRRDRHRDNSRSRRDDDKERSRSRRDEEGSRRKRDKSRSPSPRRRSSSRREDSRRRRDDDDSSEQPYRSRSSEAEEKKTSKKRRSPSQDSSKEKKRLKVDTTSKARVDLKRVSAPAVPLDFLTAESPRGTTPGSKGSGSDKWEKSSSRASSSSARRRRSDDGDSSSEAEDSKSGRSHHRRKKSSSRSRSREKSKREGDSKRRRKKERSRSKERRGSKKRGSSSRSVFDRLGPRK